MDTKLILYVTELKEIVAKHVKATLRLNNEVTELHKTVHELTSRVAELERKNN